MNAEQKRAWLFVGSGIACLVLYVGLIPVIGARLAMVAFAVFAVNGFAGLIGRKEPVDERDKAIARQASRSGFLASYLTFLLGCMGTWAAVFAWQGKEHVSVHALPQIACMSILVCFFVRSIAVLVLYGRHVEADDA